MIKPLLRLSAVLALTSAWLPVSVLAEYPAADYSLSFDGNVSEASAILGGSALPITQSAPKTSDYILVRDSDANRAMVGSDTAQPWNEGLDPFQSGCWSMLAVARGAEVANGVYWDVGWCAWQQTNPAGWCTGFSLIRTANGETALVRRLKGADPETILSAKVENDTTKFHAYLVTHNPDAAGTEASPYFVLYVDGVKVAQSTTLYQVWRNGYQFCGVYGGAPNANLANGNNFAIDEIGIWQTELTAAQAAEISASYPIWPNITRYAAQADGDTTVSALDWTPAWEDSPASIGHITAADGVCLTFDAKPTAYSFEIESEGGVALKADENGGLDNVSTLNLNGVAGKIVLDATMFSFLGSFQLSDTATVRVEDAKTAVLPVSPDGYLALMNKTGQTLEIAAPLVAPVVDGNTQLMIGQSQGTQGIVWEENASINVGLMVVGALNFASVHLLQKGGSVTVNGSGDALQISKYPLSDSSYELLGGSCDVVSGRVLLGLEYTAGEGRPAALSVGGGADVATLRTGGVRSFAYRSEAHTLSVKTNGVVEIGVDGVDLAGPNGRFVLEGGLVRAVASSVWSAADGIHVDGDVIVEVAEGENLFVSNLKGEGTLTKTGLGSLIVETDNAAFGGSVVVASGTLGFADGAMLGAGTLSVDGSARLGAFVSADLLVRGGEFSINTTCLVQGAALPAIVAVAPNGKTVLDSGKDYALMEKDSAVVLTFPARVDGHAAWFDFLFNRAQLPARRIDTRNVRNAGYAGVSAYLTLEGAWTGLNGYDPATGMLKLQTAPCRDMTDAFSWPQRWTVVLAVQIPSVQDLCLLGIGSTYFTSCNFLALATGASSGSLRLVKGHGHAAAETLVEKTIPTLAPSTRHLLAVSYDGSVCKVYHAAGLEDVGEIGSYELNDFALGGGFQVGSIHGGVVGTGLQRVDEVPAADGCGIRAVRIFESVLDEAALRRLGDELVRQRGMSVIVK